MPDTATLEPQTQAAQDEASFHDDVDALLNEVSSLVEEPDAPSAADEAVVLSEKAGPVAESPAEPDVSGVDDGGGVAVDTGPAPEEVVAVDSADSGDHVETDAEITARTLAEEVEIADPVPAGESSSSPEIGEAPPSSAANPWAAEVAELEQDWGQHKEDQPAAPASPAADTHDDQPAPAEASAGSAQPRRRFSLAFVRKLARFPGTVLVHTLIMADKPFGFLGPRLKNLLGYLAIATLGLAVVVWFAGPMLRQRFLGW